MNKEIAELVVQRLESGKRWALLHANRSVRSALCCLWHSRFMKSCARSHGVHHKNQGFAAFLLFWLLQGTSHGLCVYLGLRIFWQFRTQIGKFAESVHESSNHLHISSSTAIAQSHKASAFITQQQLAAAWRHSCTFVSPHWLLCCSKPMLSAMGRYMRTRVHACKHMRASTFRTCRPRSMRASTFTCTFLANPFISIANTLIFSANPFTFTVLYHVRHCPRSMLEALNKHLSSIAAAESAYAQAMVREV